MLVGKISSGKTTLSQRLTQEALEYRKTQSIEVIGGWIIDTPGEYLERRSFYSALLVTSSEADVVILVHDASDTNSMFAPQLAGMFSCPVIGVVTKSDLAKNGDIERNLYGCAGGVHIDWRHCAVQIVGVAIAVASPVGHWRDYV